MKTVSRVVRVALAGGLVAGAAAVAMPNADAAVKEIGTCSGLHGLGKISPGLGNTKQLLTVSIKGDAAGTCSTSKNAGTASGSVSKWGAKVSGITTCINDPSAAPDDNPATSYPLNGKLAVVAGSINLQGYVRTDGFKASTTTVVQTAGIITKGTAVGATINSELFFVPVMKTKAAPLLPGLPTGYDVDLGNAGGCQDTTGSTPANITGIYVGDGCSPLFETDCADSMSITIGR